MKKNVSSKEKQGFFKTKKHAIMTVAGGVVALVLVAVGVSAAFGSGKSSQPAPEESVSAPAVGTMTTSEPSVPPAPSESQEMPEASEAVPVAAPSESKKVSPSAPRSEGKKPKEPSAPSVGTPSASSSSTGSVHIHNWLPQTTTVHHEAEYQMIRHEAEYTTVHHDAVTQVKYKCLGCGQLFDYAQRNGHREYAAAMGLQSCMRGFSQETTVIADAYDERVLVRDAWEEPVLIRDAWDEVKTIGYACACGETK